MISEQVHISSQFPLVFKKIKLPSVKNQAENGKFNLIWINLAKISIKFPCMQAHVFYHNGVLIEGLP